jgi:hypothetical protein
MSRSSTATPRQLAYAKTLAEQTGTTFVMPKTTAQASREIKRLLALKTNSKGSALIDDCTDDQLSLASASDATPHYGTEPAPEEIQGYGSTATWRRTSSIEPPATDKQLAFIRDLAGKAGSPVPEPATRRQASREIDRLLTLTLTRERQEAEAQPSRVAAYTVGSESRVLRATRLDAGLRLVDEPDGAAGERYVIERELQMEDAAELDALVGDYLAQAQTLQAIPMASSAIRHDLAA